MCPDRIAARRARRVERAKEERNQRRRSLSRGSSRASRPSTAAGNDTTGSANAAGESKTDILLAEMEKLKTLANGDDQSAGPLHPPALLGVLDPDINKSTPPWKFHLDIAGRANVARREAQQVLDKIEHDRRKRERRQQRERESLASADSASTGASNSRPSTSSSSSSSSSSSTLGAGRRRTHDVRRHGRRPNKHDYEGHNAVAAALASAFTRTVSPLRKIKDETAAAEREKRKLAQQQSLRKRRQERRERGERSRGGAAEDGGWSSGEEQDEDKGVSFGFL